MTVSPDVIEDGLAVSVQIGATGAVTMTVTEQVSVPPGPVAVPVYVVVVDGLTDLVPVTGFEPIP